MLRRNIKSLQYWWCRLRDSAAFVVSRKTRTGSVKRKINNAVTLVLELFRRAHGDKCYLQRNNKQKEPIDNQISPSNKVDVQEILSRLKKRPEYEKAKN